MAADPEEPELGSRCVIGACEAGMYSVCKFFEDLIMDPDF